MEAWQEAFRDSPEYARWHALHQRASLGEILTPEDQAFYEAVDARLDAREAETLDRTHFARARQLRERIAAADQEMQTLLARRQEIQSRVRALEARLDTPARRALGLDPGPAAAPSR